MAAAPGRDLRSLGAENFGSGVSVLEEYRAMVIPQQEIKEERRDDRRDDMQDRRDDKRDDKQDRRDDKRDKRDNN
jgi:hypothetical protein